MMRKLMLHLGPRFEGALYTLLLSRVIGLEAASALVLIGIPILIVRVLRYRAS
jgi:hypothetical protein